MLTRWRQSDRHLTIQTALVIRCGLTSATVEVSSGSLTGVAEYRSSIRAARYISNRSHCSFGITQFGSIAYILGATDLEGDGKANIAVFRPSIGTRSLRRSMAALTMARLSLADYLPQMNAIVH